VYSPQYQSERKSLSRATRLAVGFGEAEIAADPSPGPRRRELSDGAMVDFSVEDVLIRYRILSEEVVEFQRVLDLRAES
jgi:hypothetical protein